MLQIHSGLPSLAFYILATIQPFECIEIQAEQVGGDHRESFRRLIMRPPVALEPELRELPTTNDFVQFHFSFASDAEQRVPGLLLKRNNAVNRKPAVVSLHGTGSTKESQLPLMKELAERGFVAVAIDGRYHGERSKARQGAGEYEEAILRAFRTGKEHPFLYDNVWDVMRLIDYLGTRQDVDPKRIGLIGFSKGGMETYLAAAADDRISVAVPCIAVQSFRWALEHNAWQSRISTIQRAVNAAAKDSAVPELNADFIRQFYDRVVPGIYDQFDGPAMLPLIAPRPLLVINGDRDERTPLAGVTRCAEAARKAYAAAHAESQFELRIQEKTGHTVTPESQQAAIDWFVRWLKP